METFGRVFVPNATASSAEESSVMLSGAVFSNLSFEWYTAAGMVHPKLKEFPDNQVSVRTKVTALNRDGEEETYTLQLLLPSPVKDVAVGGPSPEYFKQFCKLEREMAEKYQLLDASDDDELSRFTRSQGILSFLLSEHEPALKSSLLLQLSMFLHADDLMDESDDVYNPAISAGLQELSYAQLHATITPILEMLDNYSIGKSSNVSQLSTAWHASGLFSSLGLHNSLRLKRVFQGLTQVLHDWLEEMTRMAAGDRQRVLPLVSSVRKVYESTLFESCAEAQDTPEDILPYLGRHTSAVWPVLETVALQQGVHLGEDIRSSFLFRWWLDRLADHASRINDLFSYPKERIAGKGKQVYRLHMNSPEGPSLREAVEKVQEEADACLRDVMKVARLLNRMWGEGDEGEALREYLEIGRRVIIANIQGVGCLPRYGDKPLVWDCVVHDQKWEEE